MEKNVNVLEKISNTISFILFDIAIFSIIAWPFVMVIYVILRYVGISWLFVEEFTEYWLVIIVFFSLTYTFKTGGHIIIDFIIDKLPNNYRRTIGLITDFLTLFVLLYLLNKGLSFARYGFFSQVKSLSNQILLWPFYALIPIGLTSFSFELIIKLYREIKYFLKNT